jgi:hypothetical protein
MDTRIPRFLRGCVSCWTAGRRMGAGRPARPSDRSSARARREPRIASIPAGDSSDSGVVAGISCRWTGGISPSGALRNRPRSPPSNLAHMPLRRPRRMQHLRHLSLISDLDRKSVSRAPAAAGARSRHRPASRGAAHGQPGTNGPRHRQAGGGRAGHPAQDINVSAASDRRPGAQARCHASAA